MKWWFSRSKTAGQDINYKTGTEKLLVLSMAIERYPLIEKPLILIRTSEL